MKIKMQVANGSAVYTMKICKPMRKPFLRYCAVVPLTTESPHWRHEGK